MFWKMFKEQINNIFVNLSRKYESSYISYLLQTESTWLNLYHLNLSTQCSQKPCKFADLEFLLT